MEISYQRILRLPGKVTLPRIKRFPLSFKRSVFEFFYYVKSLGYSDTLDEYEKVKLGVFNQISFFQFIAGIFILFTCVLHREFPAWACMLASLPVIVCLLVLYFNREYQYQSALIAYFILHPLVAGFIFMNGVHLGLNLYFILYGILAVFFLKDKGFMIFTISFSMINFFVLSIVLKDFYYQLETINKTLYLINEGIAIVFIFYGLYLIKNENSIYYLSILRNNEHLNKKNIQIQVQADKIKENATLLERQTRELTELNAVKNKMFGIISHDLKAPMHAIRNLFSDVEQNRISPAQLKKLIPEVVNDMNYTVELMDNLLQWVKTQMESEIIYLQRVDMGKLMRDAVQLVRLQAERKQITIGIKVPEEVFGIMDKEMINLVLRNLLSNAIKFTPEKGVITAGVNVNKSLVEIYIKDSGEGISQEALQKIRSNNFYTTRGTANEAGTGLG
ncbi:MAG TPA: HAMP domain-containing sensor histidine kinase, partial [Chitinophagaceae bacterium]|nr:HAMP domain-containing sensor histidine kinase [Chitinophagaceae bacterium]